MDRRIDAESGSIRCGELRVDARRLGHVSRAIENYLRSDSLPPADLTFDRVQLVDGLSTSALWEGVAVSLSPADSELGRELRIQAGVAGSTAEAIRLVALRNRQIDPPATRVELTTGEAGMPCSLLGGLLLGADALGREARFTGDLSVTFDGATSGAATGALSGVQPSRLVGRAPTALALDEPAQLWVDELRWSDDRIETLRARVEVGDGSAGRGLIYAANTWLGCRPGELLYREWQPPASNPISFDGLGLTVELDANGLRLAGRTENGVLLARQGEPLLLAPHQQILPIESVLRFVAPPDAPLRPTGGNVEAFADRLPLSQGGVRPIPRFDPRDDRHAVRGDR